MEENVNLEKQFDNLFLNIIPKISSKWLNMISFDKVKIIQDYIYPSSLTPLRPGEGMSGEKMNGGAKYIVIHDTGMIDKINNAKGLNEYIHLQASSPTGRVASWHFSVDEQETYQHVPLDEVAWHAGDGGRMYNTTYINASSNVECIGGGNKNGIGIETCIYRGGNYCLTLKNTAKLVSELLHKLNLKVSDIKQHYNFSGKFCPNIIRSNQGMFESFLKDVELCYNLYKISPDVKIKWSSSDEGVITNFGEVKKPILDSIVEIKLEVILGGFLKKYTYETLVKGLSVDERIDYSYFEIFSYNTLLDNFNLRKNAGIKEFYTKNEKYKTNIKWNIIEDNHIILEIECEEKVKIKHIKL